MITYKLLLPNLKSNETPDEYNKWIEKIRIKNSKK